MTAANFRLPASWPAALAIALLTPFGATHAAGNLERRVEAATEVLKDLQRIPEQAIPPNLLDSAYAVAVIPNVIKGGFIVGGSYGKGLLTVRQSDGTWSNPAFITLANLGIGWQLGAQGADLVLVFKSQRGVDNIARGKFTLGGSASASAGPVGRTALAMTDGEFKSEIYTYARSRGLFAGVSLDGGAITIDQDANTAWYGAGDSSSATRIFTDRSIPTAPAVVPLLAALGKMAPSLTWKVPGANAGQNSAVQAPPAGETAAPSTTYPVDDGAAGGPETRF